VARADRPRYQVVLTSMPGSEPWVRVEGNFPEFKLPALCSILELLEILEGRRTRKTPPSGEVFVRVPLEVALASPTIGAYRRRGARS